MECQQNYLKKLNYYGSYHEFKRFLHPKKIGQTQQSN